MSYFTLPKNHGTYDIESKIKPKFNNIENIKCVINKTLSNYLNICKLEIEKYSYTWDSFKKYTNPYEFIHTSIDNTKLSICKHKPLSRSFYKLIEIVNTFELLNNVNNPIKTFHLAEGPGGFIEAIIFLRNNNLDRYYGMTLIDNTNVNIPGWNKSLSFLNKNSNVTLEYGYDKTGDLMNCENLLYIYKHYKNSCYIVTADGGFDFTTDFNNQEIIRN